MSYRPYFNSSIEELFRAFDNKKNDLTELHKLKFELINRHTKRAKELENRIDDAIKEFENEQIDFDDDAIEFSDEIELYPWQKRALDAWKENEYVGVVEAVTGAGKTHVAMSAMLEHLKIGWKVVVVVPSIALQEQWLKKISDIINKKLNNSYQISLMGGSENLKPGFDILIAISNSASQYVLLPENEKGLLIADECHRYGAKSWSKILEPEFERRLGLTATYEREDNGIDEYLAPYFNGICYSLRYGEALNEEVIANFKIAFIGVEFEEEELSAYEEIDSQCRSLRYKLIHNYGVSAEPFGKFMKEVSILTNGGNSDNEVTKIARRYMSSFSKRRKLIANATQKMECLRGLVPSIEQADRTIIFSQTKDAAEEAVCTLKEFDLNASVLDATMSMKERKAVFADFENGDEDIVAAPMLMDEGVDVPSADLAIILAASRSKRQMIQRMGRVLRNKDDGRLARIAIIYVKGSFEDPDMGAHEAFIDAIRDAATEEEIFDANYMDGVCDFLNSCYMFDEYEDEFEYEDEYEDEFEDESNG